MINTYRYSGTSKVKKEGKEVVDTVPSSIVLNRVGPFLNVTITHPRSVQEMLRKNAEEIPAESHRALIDTGASSSVISPSAADKLKLVHTGYQKISSVHDEQDRPVYYGLIMFPWGGAKEIPIVCCNLKGFDCLIGRDILQHWHFSYNGPDGSIVICD